MKTPYDAPLRALQRGIDDLRTSIGMAANRLVEVETMDRELRDAVRRETALASLDWTVPAGGYLSRARAQRERLAEERRAAQLRLEALRQQAVEAYGSLRAVESAAEVFREDASRVAASAEQSQSDDFAGARFARQLHVARRNLRARAQSR